jgi:hypothetical protein
MHTALCRPLQLLAQQRQVPAAAPVRPPLSQPCWGDLPTLIFLQGVRRASRPGPSKCDKEAAWDFSQLSTFCCPDPGECNENAAEYWGAPAEDRGGGTWSWNTFSSSPHPIMAGADISVIKSG